MRSRAAAVLGAVLVMLAPVGGPSAPAAATVAVNDCWSTDNGLPRVTSVTLGATSADSRDGPVEVPVSVLTRDTGGPGPATGVTEVRVSLGRPPVTKTPAKGVLVDLFPSAGEEWVGTAVVPRWGEGQQIWQVWAVRVVDGAGNRLDLTEAQLEAAGQAPRLDVTTATDGVCPQVVDLRVRPHRLDTRDGAVWLRLRARVTDGGGSGVRTVVADGARLRRVRGSVADGWWAGRRLVRPWEDDGRHRLTIEATDAAGNTRQSWWKRLRDRDLPWFVTIRSRPDDEPPRLRDRRVGRSTVDVRAADGSVRVRVRSVDRGSATAAVWLLAPGDPALGGIREVPLRLRAGTRRDGVWRGRLPLPQCWTAPGPYVVRVLSRDRAGNESATRIAGRVRVRALDHQRPVVQTASEFRPGSALVVTFSEPVSGVTPTSLVLRRTTGDGAPAIVPGSWQCIDPAGAQVDCVSGSVAAARFQASEPAQRGTGYALVANPEGVLDLTDLAGNPAPPRLGPSWATAP